MSTKDNFKQIRQRINMYFDNELSQEDKSQLLHQVDEDPRCQKIFHKEKNFRDFIKSNVKQSTVSPDLIQNIRDRIRIV